MNVLAKQKEVSFLPVQEILPAAAKPDPSSEVTAASLQLLQKGQ